MALTDFKTNLSDEISTILARDFQINVTKTAYVPHSGDGAITFPNLDAKSQNCKLLQTCVLYIDIRRSTELNIAHKPETVAKLYSAFVRAMTQSARYFNGHVRGIIGDRVMVIYDTDNAYTNAVNTAVLMNSVAQLIINRHFTRGEVTCGIGIDAGNVLATKTGIRRRQQESSNYKSLVWLGRPANVASKLTDIANKPEAYEVVDVLKSGYDLGLPDWRWITQSPEQFLNSFTIDRSDNNRGLRAILPEWRSSFASKELKTTRPQTPPILMTEKVYKGFRSESPGDDCFTKRLLSKVDVTVSGYSDAVFGGDVMFTAFNS